MVRIPPGGTPAQLLRFGLGKADLSKTKGVGGADAVSKTQAPRAAPAPRMGESAFPGDLQGAGLAMKAELHTLENEARVITAKVATLETENEEKKVEVQRATEVSATYATAGKKERASAKEAKAVRRAAYNKAKGQIDSRLDELRSLGVPEPELQAARKHLLRKLARSAIRAGSKGRYGKEQKGALEAAVKDKLQSLQAQVPADKKAQATRALDGLLHDLTGSRDSVASRQETLTGHRIAIKSCDEKQASYAHKAKRGQAKIDKNDAELGKLKPKLQAINSRIGELKAAIGLLEMMSRMMEIEEAAAERKHERTMEKEDQADLRQQRQAIQKRAEQLEETLRASDKLEDRAHAADVREMLSESRVGMLESAVDDLRAAAQRPGARSPQLQRALAAVERMITRVEAAEAAAE